MYKAVVRLCGDLLLGIELQPDSESYTVGFWLNGEKVHKLYDLHRSPHHCRIYAADSSHAYDVVAQAAMSFAAWTNDDVYAWGEQDEAGSQWLVRR
jgi:hypothetical protein